MLIPESPAFRHGEYVNTEHKRLPRDDELVSFMDNAESETQLSFYRNSATSILKEFLEKSLVVKVDEISTKLKAEYANV